MAKVTYDKEITALLVIDPYNDFISEGGKVWDRLKAVAEANRLCSSYVASPECCAEGGASRLLCAASSIPSRRLRDLEIHCAYAEGSLVSKDLRKRHVGWRDPPRIRTSTGRYRGPRALVFQWLCQHRFGFAAQKARHPSSSSSSGLIAHTCVEATVRFAAELGYEVTMVKDATADYSDEEMHAALDVNIPNYASAIVTTNEVVDSISSL